MTHLLFNCHLQFMVCNYTNPTKGVLNGSSIKYRLQVLGLAKATLPNILPFPGIGKALQLQLAKILF